MVIMDNNVLGNLAKFADEIYETNSYSDLNKPGLVGINTFITSLEDVENMYNKPEFAAIVDELKSGKVTGEEIMCSLRNSLCK